MGSENEEYQSLLKRWRAGDRDRETGLRLIFLAWYCIAEPTEFTGLPDDGSSLDVVREVFDWFGGEDADDPEFLATVSLMASVAEYALGDDDEWKRIGLRFSIRAPRIGIDLLPADFEGRGAYGACFAHHANRRWLR